jgi:hypothetical protein
MSDGEEKVVVRRFRERVAKVEEVFERRNYRQEKVGDRTEWVYDDVSLGWFVVLANSREKTHFGMERPDDVAVGDLFEVSFRKVEEKRDG